MAVILPQQNTKKADTRVAALIRFPRGVTIDQVKDAMRKVNEKFLAADISVEDYDANIGYPVIYQP